MNKLKIKKKITIMEFGITFQLCNLKKDYVRHLIIVEENQPILCGGILY
jgi:hypothetical protein